MKTSLHLALAVFFVYAMHTCTCAPQTTQTLEEIVLFNEVCLEERVMAEMEKDEKFIENLQPAIDSLDIRKAPSRFQDILHECLDQEKFSAYLEICNKVPANVVANKCKDQEKLILEKAIRLFE